MSGIVQGLLASFSSAAAVVTDAYFYLVTLLLNTTSTNGAQNNTFLDSSSLGATVTRNGNTTQGTFTPFSQTGWSNYFGGSADYFTMPDNASYVISGDFTVEAWIFPTSFGGTNGNIILSQWPGTGTATNQAFQFLVNSTGKVSLVYGIGATNASVTGTSLSATLNTWNHVAVSRSGTTVRFFVNGSLDTTTGTVSGSFNDSTGVMTVGRINGTDSGYFSGYISNCRLTVGGALYTSAFTPSTTPLGTTVSSGTVYLLTCQNNRFIDNSTLNATITVAGTPSVQAFSPFAPTAAYSTASVGGSGYFGATGDYLTVPYSTTNFDWFTGGTDYTIEVWINPLSAGWNSGGVPCTVGNLNPTSTQGYWALGINASSQPTFYYYNGAAVSLSLTSVVCQFNTWNHIAMVKTSSGIQIFCNGVGGTVTAISGTPQSSATYPLSIGQYNSVFCPGYISNVRVVKGTALYSGTTYTVPTAPFTAVTNTKLLISETNAAIYDAAAKNDLQTVGNAQVSTTQAKFGTTSMAFDGTGDYLQLPAAPNLALFAGDFTVEMWVYPTSYSAATNYPLWDTRGSATSTAGYYFALSQTNGYPIVYLYPSIILTGSSGPSLNTWSHVAFCRASGTIRAFVNGTQVGSVANSNSITDPSVYISRIGQSAVGGVENFTGYIDEFRISRYARYTANFTAPTAAFPTQ